MRNIFKKIFKTKVSLIDSLPPIKGKAVANFPLRKKTWFGVGGPAEVYVEPADIDDLSYRMYGWLLLFLSFIIWVSYLRHQF